MAKKKNKLTEEQRLELERLKALEAQRQELETRVSFQKKRAEKEQRAAEEEIKRKNTSIFISSTQFSIPIRDIYKGIVITKDGRYVKIIEFKAQNFHMLPTGKQNAIAQGFASVLDSSPYKIQFKVLSTKASTDTLVEKMVRLRKKEKDSARAKLQDEYIKMVRNTALSQGVTRRFFIIIEFDKTTDNDGTNIDAIVDSLNSTAMSIASQMSELGNPVVMKSLDGSNQAYLQELFWTILNRKTAEEEPFMTRVADVLSAYDARTDIPADRKRNIPATDMVAPKWIDFEHSNYMAAGNYSKNYDTGEDEPQGKFYTFAYLSKDTYPTEAIAGWMDYFVNVSEGIDVDIFVEPVPNDKIEEKIGLQVRMNRSKIKDTADTTTDFRVTEDVIASGEFILDAMANGQKFYYVSILATITADTRENLEHRYKYFKRTLKGSLGLELIRPRFQMEHAFSSALPLCKLDKRLARKMKHNIMTGGLSTMYPFLSYEMQDPNGIMMGVNRNNNSLVSVDVFDTDVHVNANGAIMGMSGMGKTYTAQLLATRWVLQGIQTFIITPMKGKEDYARACKFINGQFVQLGPGSPFHINVFDIAIPDNTVELEDSDRMEISLLDQKVQSLETFMGLLYKDMTEIEEGLLQEYIYKAYAAKGITSDNESIFIPGTRQKKEMPILEDVYNLIADVPELRRLYAVMTKMVKGALSCYNKPTNVDLSNKYIVFDLGGKEGEDLSVPMYIVLDYVWGRIKENKLEKKAVLIDEAWQLIGSNSNKKAAEFVRQIFKTIRAFGGAAFVMTQQVEDFFALDNGIYGTAIINNADTKILLGMSPRDVRHLAEIMELTPEEEAKILKQKRGEGLLTTGGARLFVRFTSSPYEHKAITTDVKEIAAEMAESGVQ